MFYLTSSTGVGNGVENDQSESVITIKIYFHYENLPMQYTEEVLGCKNKIFSVQSLIFSLFLLKT